MRSTFKKTHGVICVVVTIVLIVIYLWALLLPGFWYGDTFLYKQKDGSFAGSDMYANYKMNINDAEYGTYIEFSACDKTKYYQIKYDDNDWERKVEVFENGTLICKGRALGYEENYIVIDDETGLSDEIEIRVNGIPDEEKLFPGCTALYGWAVSDKNETRGNPYMIFCIILLSLILFLDIRFPNLFWILEHRLEVDGGEPSDWYLFGQKVGRVMLFIGILVCIFLTFTLH